MNHESLMVSLKSRLKLIKEVIPEGSDIVYFDYPLHLNVGDLLIYHGTLEFFSESKYHVTGVYNIQEELTPSVIFGISNESVIVCHGGGNFGDLYLKHQRLREHLIKVFPNNKIVILPQSLYFESDEDKVRSEQIFRTHHDVHVYCRDEVSYGIAKGFSDKVYLMPDMAHYLWGTPLLESLKKITGEKQNYGLYQDRVDGEKNPLLGTDIDLSKFDVFDWYDSLPRWVFWSCSIIRNLSRYSKGGLCGRSLFRIWRHTALACIRCSANKLNKYDRFITTRLHGHIFALLLSKPHQSLDNNYGKISSYMNAWTSRSDILH